jgi:hypothetical protein
VVAVDLGSMNEDGGSLTITMAQLLSGASDVEGDTLTASNLTLSDPAAGTLTDNGDGTWTFTPAQTGTEIFPSATTSATATAA